MAKHPQPQLRELTLPDLHPSRNQPRHTMSAETIAAIKAAIEDNGGEYPQDMAITVRPRLAGGFEIIAGHHRHTIEAAGLFLNAHDLRGQLEEVLEDARDLS